MISIYLDWNVITQLKNGYNPRLKEILNTDRFLIPYSTSHIGDIFASYSEDSEQLKNISEDLDYITLLSKNNCLINNSHAVYLELNDPKDLFQQRINEKDLLKDFSIDSLLNILDSNKDGKQAIETLKNMPLNQVFGDAFNNSEISEQMDLLFPGLRDNQTVEGFFKCFSSMIVNMNESEDYKQLRKIIQNGLNINRDKIFSSSDPYKIIKESYEKNKINTTNLLLENGQYAPKWFNDISNEYLSLDLHGYQEDRVTTTKKNRKETFRNTTEDAFHASFASTCHFYITNDKKSFEKTQKVYDKLRLDTLIFTPDDFIEYYQTFLSPRDIDLELEIPFQYLESN